MEDERKAGSSQPPRDAVPPAAAVPQGAAAPQSSAGATEAESAPPADRGPQASKDDLGTDLSEIARARLSDSDKSTAGGERAAHAEELALGAAGTDTDDETAQAVESGPTAQISQSHPGPVTRTEGGPETPTPVPAPQAPRAAPTQSVGGSASAPTDRNPSGTGTPTVSPADASGETTPAEPASSPTQTTAARAPGPPAAQRAAASRTAAPAKPVTPAKPPEPEPEELAALKEIAPELSWERRHGYVEAKIAAGHLPAVAARCKQLGYDYLSAVTGVDWRERVEMLYHLYSYDYVAHPGCIVLRVDLPPEPNPLCPSLTSIWPGADYQERELYDLMGIKFVGHPDLRRILTEERFPGHPLRKDWTFDYEYVLVRHLRHGAEGQQAPPGGEEGFRRV